MWYYATVLYFGNYYRKDPRERAGLAASAIAVSLSSYLTFFFRALNFIFLTVFQRVNQHNYPIVAGTSLFCRAVGYSIVSDILALVNRM